MNAPPTEPPRAKRASSSVAREARNVWILPASTRVAPFGDAASLPVLGRPLREAMIGEIAEAGLTLAGGSPGEGIHVPGDVFVNAAALRAIASGADGSDPNRSGSGNRFRSGSGSGTDTVTDRIGSTVRIRAPGWARMAGGPIVRETGIVGPGAIEIDAEEKSLSLSPGRDELAIAAPRRIAARIATWSDLLWVNLFAMSSRIVSMSPAKGASLVLLAALRARSLNKWRIAGALVQRGKGCDVHPSAVVEASVLGANVRVGAGAIVRGSILGDGVDVEEHALVTGSVLGAKCVVERFAMVKFSVLGERVLAGGAIQLSVLGDGAALRMGSYTMDRPLGGENVRVATEAGLVEAGPALGVALGPGASIGTGVWIAPGRAIPAGVIVTRGPQDVLARIPDALAPGVYGVENGTLVSPKVRPKASE